MQAYAHLSRFDPCFEFQMLLFMEYMYKNSQPMIKTPTTNNIMQTKMKMKMKLNLKRSRIAEIDSELESMRHTHTSPEQ